MYQGLISLSYFGCMFICWFCRKELWVFRDYQRNPEIVELDIKSPKVSEVGGNAEIGQITRLQGNLGETDVIYKFTVALP
jgi:hypothetical protein